MHVIDHPGVQHHLTQLRDVDTGHSAFRSAAEGVTRYLVAEVMRTAQVMDRRVQTPLESTVGSVFAEEFVFVPILRAGLGMLDASLQMVPEARVGYLGLERDEESAVARSYYAKLPNLHGRTVILLDPMLATGGSAVQAVEALVPLDPRRVIMVSIIAAPEGVAFFRERCPSVELFLGCVDRELDTSKYIRPGLGDFGDRLYGTFPG